MKRQAQLPIEELICKVNDNGYNIHICQTKVPRGLIWSASLFDFNSKECATVTNNPHKLYFDSMREVVELAVFLSKHMKQVREYKTPEKVEEESTCTSSI